MNTRLASAMLALTALGAGGCVVAPQAAYDGPPPAYYAAPQPSYGATADYYWIDLADGFADAIGSSPPDYAFAWAGATAWAWAGISGEMLLIERTADGDIQYYFEPGAVTPYLVRDPDRSFAFDRGVLVAIHDRTGTIIADGARPRDRQDGDALLRRAVDLMAASRQRQWDGRSAGLWSSSFGYDYVINSGWTHSWRSRPDWNDHYRSRAPHWRSPQFDDERRWRRDHADRFRDWQRRGSRGTPPRMEYMPVQPALPPAVVTPPAGPTAPVTGRRPPRNQVDPPGGPVGVVRQPPVAADVADDGNIREPARGPGRGPPRGRINDNEPGELLPMPPVDGGPVSRALPPRPPMRQRPPAVAPVATPEVEQPAAVNVPRSRPAPLPRAERQPPPPAAPAAAVSPPPVTAPPAYSPPPRVERPAPPAAAAPIPAPERVQPAPVAPPPPAYSPPPRPQPAPRDIDQPRVRNNSIDDDGSRPD